MVNLVLKAHVAQQNRFAPCPVLKKPEWLECVLQLKNELRKCSIDVLEPLCVGWYNEEVDALERIKASPGQLAVLIGTTRNIWSAFTAACLRDEQLMQSDHPLDKFVEQRVRAAAAALGMPVRVFFGHDEPTDGEGSRSVALQRAAAAAGLAYLDAGSHLCLHPKFGPWFALRATLVFDAVEYTGPRKPRVPNPLPPSTQAYLHMAVRSAQGPNAADAAGGRPPSREAVRARWRQWVAVRDAPCPGHPWRYSDAQLHYHYTANRAALLAALKSAPRR
ncbi:hypothetical protein WJX81_006518 [Elliptochloris bilobata]|uniref:Cyanocobalamin reductase (cyanide-eliminating) n=1 Tax=Elliptochloris bilobata TaxID=381761 RepID=A0AAW1QYE8_9CHLO